MKYAREVTVGNQVRLTEVVTIAPSGEVDPITWLGKHMPHLSPQGWVLVAEDNINGAVKNGNVYDNPTIPTPSPKYKKLSQPVVREIMDTVFGNTRTLAVDAALAALTTDAWKVRMKQYNNPGKQFTRDQVIDFLTAARNADVPSAGAKITVAEITAIADDTQWLDN